MSVICGFSNIDYTIPDKLKVKNYKHHAEKIIIPYFFDFHPGQN
jgi:hypothetical protein